MNDDLSLAFDADYKVYELGSVIDSLEDLMAHPSARKTLNANWPQLRKSLQRLQDLINNMGYSDACTG